MFLKIDNTLINLNQITHAEYLNGQESPDGQPCLLIWYAGMQSGDQPDGYAGTSATKLYAALIARSQPAGSRPASPAREMAGQEVIY